MLMLQVLWQATYTQGCWLQRSSTCTRWMQTGRCPGRMYWLKAGTMFGSKAMMVFAGVHSLQHQVYFCEGHPALAIQQPVQDEMQVACTGCGVTHALCLAHNRMSYVRIVSQAAEQVTYHGVWLITSITEQSAESAQVDMMSMPDLP